MVNSKEVTKEIETSIPVCRFCGCLIAKPCTSLNQSYTCPNNQIDYKTSMPDDFNPELN